MKQLTKTLAFFALVFISGTVLASGNLNVSIVQGANNEAIIRISNAVDSKYKIEIQNDAGDVIYYKETKSPSKTYQNVYDFSKLDDGNYTFTVKLNKEFSQTDLRIDNGKVKVMEQDKELDPFFAYQNDILKLSYLNYDLGDVKMYIYEQGSNNLVYEVDLGSDFALHHALDFSKLRTGKYDAVLVGDLKSYEYELKVN
jgi:hypothetical protein